MLQAKKIPLIVMEEHKEAYYAWHLFADRGDIPPYDNILLHVDHHEDNIGGVYNIDMDALPKNLEYSKYLSYEEFGIANFILPAIYERMFTKMICIMNFGTDVEYQTAYYEHRCNEVEGVKKYFLDRIDSDALDEGLKREIKDGEEKHIVCNIRSASCFRGGLGDYGSFQRPVVLDIDLDYFCWSNTLKDGTRRIVEITEDAWRKIRENTYDGFRLTPILDVQLLEIDGKYYLELVKQSVFYEKDEEVTTEILKERLDKFFSYLDNQKFIPAVIDVCRSRISGYLNKDFFPWIENEVLRRLDEIYGTDIIFRPPV